MFLKNGSIFHSRFWYIGLCALVGLGTISSEYAVVTLLKGTITGETKDLSLAIFPVISLYLFFEYLCRSLPEFFRIRFTNLAIFTTLRAHLNSKLQSLDEYNQLNSSVKHAGQFISKTCNLAIELTVVAAYTVLVCLNFGMVSLFAFIPLGVIALFLIRSKKVSLQKDSSLIARVGQLRWQMAKNAQGLKLSKSVMKSLVHMEKLQKEVESDEQKINVGKYKIHFITELAGALVVISAFFIGVKYFNFGVQSALIYFYAFIRLAQKSGNINRHLVYYDEYSQTYQRLMNKLDVEFEEEKHIPNERISSISLQNVTFGYSAPLTSPLSLTIPQGQFVILKGKSGSGKSTLLKTLAGQLSPLNGDIHFNHRADKISARIGYFASRPELFNASLSDNLTFFDLSKNHEIMRTSLAKSHCDFMKNSEADTFINADDVSYSTGQLQRLNLARIFVDNHSLIILDEAFSNLDQETEKNILDEILKLKANRIILMATHKSTFDHMADHIIHLEGLV